MESGGVGQIKPIAKANLFSGRRLRHCSRGKQRAWPVFASLGHLAELVPGRIHISFPESLSLFHFVRCVGLASNSGRRFGYRKSPDLSIMIGIVAPQTEKTIVSTQKI